MSKYQYFRLFSISAALLVGFWLPVRLVGFTPPIALEITFDILISLVSVINIALHFHDKEKNPRLLKSWYSFGLILDAVCLIPLSLFSFFLFDGVGVDSILFLNLFTVRHIGHIKKFLDGFPSLQPISYRLIPVCLSLPLLVHLVSCGWIGLGSGTAGTDPDPVLTYVKAIYWAFTTLTTVGYGDISAKTISQMLFSCGVQVVGVGVFGFILSNVASLLARSDAPREHHMDNLDRIETYMNLHHTPQELRSKIRTYYHYMWMNKKGYKDESLLDGLPMKIQAELILHVNRSIVEKVPFLRGADSELLGELMCELKPRVFVPGEKIFRAGEKGDALYFIQNGSVDIMTPEDQILATLTEGAFFGEMALLSDKPRAATAKAQSFCDVYILSREAFDHVTFHYPAFRHHIKEVMEQRQVA